MKAPEKFRITLLGTTADIVSRGNAGAKIDHYLGQLVAGAEMPAGIFDPWYLSVELAEARELLGPLSMHAVARQHRYVQIVCAHCGRSTVYETKPLSDICRRDFIPTDLRDLGKRMRCDSRSGGCGRRGATIIPIIGQHAPRNPSSNRASPFHK